jgi:hypothetical protein
MRKIVFEIESCEGCPKLKTERVYTADSFERPYKWMCSAKENKQIAGFVEDHDAIDIPPWCPHRLEAFTEEPVKKIEKDIDEYFVFGENPSYHLPQNDIIFTSEIVRGKEAADKVMKRVCEAHSASLVDFKIAKVIS